MEEETRKGGGEEARNVRCMCDVCAAHSDRAAVGVDVDALLFITAEKGGVARSKGEG